jgi:hypothetical protein
MLIYSDRFNNGWGDSWSWMPCYATNNPVYAGSNAMACVPSGQFQAQTNNLGVGLGTNWINVSASAQTNQITLPINATGAVFFRLVRPY